MTSLRFYLCAVPRPIWENANNEYAVEIIQLVKSALSSERRIAKEVNLDAEHARYTLACQRLEQEIARCSHLKQISTRQEFWQEIQTGHFPVLTLDFDYLELLSRAIPSGPRRLGSSFFPPDMVRGHRQEFEAWAKREELSSNVALNQRYAFLEWIEKADCGLVEVQTLFHPETEKDRTAVSSDRSALLFNAQDPVDIPDIDTSGETVEFFGEGRRLHLANLLRDQIRKALSSGEPMIFEGFPHDVITQVLHELVFISPRSTVKPVRLRVAYVDGSESEPFPVYCLPRATEAPLVASAQLRVGLTSMRNIELDAVVDFYWFRNQEITRAHTLAEADRFCFEATRAWLIDGLRSGPLHMHLYHTGHPPAVIGFYRGVVERLIKLKHEDTNSLSVTPVYLRGRDKYQEGSKWI